MNEKNLTLLTKEKEKTSMNEWENDNSDILRTVYSVYEKKLGQFFFYSYLVACLNKHISVLLKVISEQGHKLV